MGKLNNSWYKIFQALSLDVVIGAVIFSMTVAWYYRVQLPWEILSCMSIAIWLIYTCDHLLDAGKIKGNASTFRHRFHKKNKKSLIVIAFILFVGGALNAWYLPTLVYYWGLIGTLITCVYFLLLKKMSFWAKEIYVAVIYTFGIFLGPLSFSYNDLNFAQWLFIPQVFLLVFSNLLLFSWFDILKDKRDGHQSMVIHLGKDKAKQLIEVIFITGIAFICIILFQNFDEFTLVLEILIFIMFSFLMLLYKHSKFFSANDFYRVIGDGIFYIPILFLLYVKLRQL